VSNRQKLDILERLAYYMEVGSTGARLVYVKMGAKIEAEVEHQLWSWIYFHDRIVEVLDRKLPQPHSPPWPVIRF
jgi:hypothetical protein